MIGPWNLNVLLSSTCTYMGKGRLFREVELSGRIKKFPVNVYIFKKIRRSGHKQLNSNA